MAAISDGSSPTSGLGYQSTDDVRFVVKPDRRQRDIPVPAGPERRARQRSLAVQPPLVPTMGRTVDQAGVGEAVRDTLEEWFSHGPKPATRGSTHPAFVAHRDSTNASAAVIAMRPRREARPRRRFLQRPRQWWRVAAAVALALVVGLGARGWMHRLQRQRSSSGDRTSGAVAAPAWPLAAAASQSATVRGSGNDRRNHLGPSTTQGPDRIKDSRATIQERVAGHVDGVRRNGTAAEVAAALPNPNGKQTSTRPTADAVGRAADSRGAGAAAARDDVRRSVSARTIRIDSNPPGASVFIDGNLIGRTPLNLSPSRARGHVVRVARPRRSRWSWLRRVVKGESSEVTASFQQ